jgi:hypothetical protein
MTMLSSLVFARLRRDDGESITKSKTATAVAQDPAPLSQA